MDKMEETLVFYFAFFIVTCAGLQFSLERDVSVTPGSRPVCGVLLCVEAGSPGHSATTSVTAPASPGPGWSDVILTASSVSSISVFRRSKPADDDSGSDAVIHDLIASVTRQTPRLTRVANSIKMDGSLTGAGATLRLELFKQDDCRADFSCQVRAVDPNGRELLSISNLLQLPERSGPSGGGDGRAHALPAVADQLAGLVSQLDARQASAGNYEDKANHLEDRLEHLEQLLTNKTERLEAQIESITNSVHHALGTTSLGNQSGSQTGSPNNGTSERSLSGGLSFAPQSETLRDSLSSLERILDKIGGGTPAYEDNPFETELSPENSNTSSSRTEIGQNFNASDITHGLRLDILEVFERLQTHIEQVELPRRAGCQCQDSIKTEIYEGQRDFANSSDSLVKELVEAMKDVVLNMTFQRDQPRDLTEAFASSLVSFNESFEQVLSGMSTTATETKEYCHSLLTDQQERNQSSFKAALESALSDILSPKICRPGMISVLPLQSFPYPVVYPEYGLGGPYLCDTVTEGGGWIIIQRRSTGTTDFYRNWAAYASGFGSFDEDFWLGNENIHAITGRAVYELRVELEYKGVASFARYSSFSVEGGRNNYTLHLGVYTGTAGDSLSEHAGRPFSTFDRDNDGHAANCAQRYFGGWWYNSCHTSNLNGLWQETASKGPRWSTFSSTDPVSFSQMKIRKVN